MAMGTDDIKRLIEVESRLQGVDPALALAVAMQESSLNHEGPGDNGRSIGLFQLQEAAARDVGLTSQQRYDPGFNIEGGVRFIKQKLVQSGGNVDRALVRYNGGGDPNYVANVRRFLPADQGRPAPSILARAASVLGPASAEAAPATAGATRLQEIEAELARRDTQQAPAQPAAPAQADPATVARFLALPSIAQLPSAEKQARLREFAGLRPDLQAQFLASETPPSPSAPVAASGLSASLPFLTPQPEAPGTTTGERMAGVDAMLDRELTPAVKGMPGLLIGAGAGTAGRMAGQAVARAAPWLGRAAGAIPTLSEAAASYAGRWLNVQLGYEQPGTAGDIASAAIPLAFRGLGAARRAVTRNMPGAGVVRHELGEEALEGLGHRLQPATDADALFAQAAAHNPDIATAGLWRTTAQILRRERGFGPALRATQSTAAAQEVLDRMTANGGPMALQELETYRQRIGALIGTATGQEQTNLRQIYAALMGDLENAAGRNVPGAEILRAALQTRRLEHGLETLTDLWSPGKGIQVEAGDITRVYGKRIQQQFQRLIHDDPLFAGSFTPGEITEIGETLRDVARMTARSPILRPGGLLKHALSASLGTATGVTAGPLAGLAVAVGVEGIPHLLAAGMRSPQGRAAIRHALDEGGGRFTAAGLGLINQAIRDAAGGEATTPGPGRGPGQ